MKHIFTPLFMMVLLSSCSFINEEKIQRSQEISIDTFLSPVSLESKIKPITITGGTSTGQLSDITNTGSEISPTISDIKKNPSSIEDKTKIDILPPPINSPTTTTTVDLSDKEIEGLVNSLFENLK